MSERIECPYCDCWQLIQDVTETDEYGEPITCNGCGNVFLYTVELSVEVEAHKAPCLNGEAHDYRTLYNLPGMKNRQKCIVCGSEFKDGDEL